MNLIFCSLCVVGGLLCAVGDCFLDLKGKDSKSLGKYGYIESAWSHMAQWRFSVSILLAMVGVPCAMLGFSSIAQQISHGNFGLGIVFYIVGIIGFSGGFFIHTILCLFPIIYQIVEKKNGFEFTEHLLNTVYDTIRIPFYLMYLCMLLSSSILLSVAVFRGYMTVSPWLLLLTPLPMLVYGGVLRKMKRDWFYDLPGIVMPSLGIAMVGVIGIVNLS